jgi:hypothetical protein
MNQTYRPGPPIPPKVNRLGWLVCQFKKHKLVPGDYVLDIREVSLMPDGSYETGYTKRWVPLHCSRCGMVFGKDNK